MIELYGSGKAQTSYNPLTPRTYLKVVSLSATQKLLRFGVYELNLATEELRKGGTSVKLSPQPFQLLALLASRASQVVTREEIQQQLWDEETFVDFEQGDEPLHQANQKCTQRQRGCTPLCRNPSTTWVSLSRSRYLQSRSRPCAASNRIQERWLCPCGDGEAGKHRN